MLNHLVHKITSLSFPNFRNDFILFLILGIVNTVFRFFVNLSCFSVFLEYNKHKE
nr:MAG TPA_asm: hypothetical protein [Caudoviricetes sp.]